MDSLTPVGGAEEEELDDQELDDQEIETGISPQDAAAPEGDEEEMPDDLLSPTELAEKKAAESGRKPVVPEREPEDRSAVVAELREIFQGLRQPAAPPEERGAQRVAPEFQPFVLSEEQAARLSEKALSEPGGIAKLIAAAVNIGDKRATARMAGSAEGQAAMESAGRVFVSDFLEQKSETDKYAKAIKPYFREILSTYNIAELAGMTKADRDLWFEETYERATGRAYSKRAVAKPSPSPGVARGAGSRPGAPARGRVVIRMTGQQKKDLRASAPRLFSGEEGEKLFRRQVWEIEHGMTDNANVRAMTRQSLQFGEAVGFGG
jgi:hypothetical protein